MSLPVPFHSYSYADYLALEDHSPVRHEFVSGEIYAMAGGTPEHAALAAAVLRHLGNQLPAGCRAYTSDLRVRVAGSDVTTYPDGTVVCGKTSRAADDPTAVTNPVVLIEVTSPSTEAYDRGAKLGFYKDLPSVREVLILSHQGPHAALHRRGQDGAWSVHEAGQGETIEVESVGASLAIDEVYRDFAE
ncbi:MAG: Uma2 family endonuclease [Myxococcales bacterium]|nr:Uma2 family endonuclease [Sorangiineae bacterium PRO1]MCL4751553.1 Uma2 family endonuclease [Myxococcales bacterium]